MGIITSLFKSLFKLLSRIFKFIKKMLPYILIILAICFVFFALAYTIPAWSAFGFEAAAVQFGGVATAGVIHVSGTTAALLAIGASAVLLPKDTAEAVSNIAGSVGESASSVVHAAGDVASDVISTVVDAVASGLSGLGLPIVAGLALWFFLSRKDDEQPGQVVEAQPDSAGFLGGVDDQWEVPDAS